MAYGMVIKFRATVMKVGNSLVLVLPKPLCEGFGIVKGQVLELIVKDEGISIPIQENPIEAPVERDVQQAEARPKPTTKASTR
jgi:antitoxin component of MazEF toxin-antitoxin module